jgi:hypothetical protein
MRLHWLILATFTLSSVAYAYPIDEGERTGIRRLKWHYNVEFNGARGRKLDPGGMWPGEQIQLKMMGSKKARDFDLTPETQKDPQLQNALEKILKKWAWRRYHIAILDITDPENPRFAGVQENVSQTPGSVAKVLVGAAMLNELKKRFPNDISKREEILRTHKVTADDWSRSDSHEVPFILDEENTVASYRRIHTGHTFTLWEWMDHALSASNNSAASTTWREATLMRLLGDEYPPEKYDKDLWARWDRDQMTEASFATVNEPLLDVGMDPEVFRLRLYFTSGANRYIHSKSCGLTPFALIRWMLKVEQGKIVDEWSSRELKKMLYLTRRRVRYLYYNTLDPYGAFFKSGSLYRFSEKAERIQYQGDIVNVLNALIEIDTSEAMPMKQPEPEEKEGEKKDGEKKDSKEKKIEPKPDAVTEPAPKTSETAADKAAAEADKPKPYVYIVAVMSNELLKNAAIDHARLAQEIHEAIIAPREKPEEEQATEEKAPGEGSEKKATPGE